MLPFAPATPEDFHHEDRCRNPDSPRRGDFAILARSLMLGGDFLGKAIAEAEAMPGGAVGRPAAILRAATTSGSIADPVWAGALVDYRIVELSFVEAVATVGLFDRVLANGMRKLPLRRGLSPTRSRSPATKSAKVFPSRSP